MSVAEIFQDAQKSTINHKSLAKRLRKAELKNPARWDQFKKDVIRCVMQVLDIPKSEKAGSTIVRFLSIYCALTQNSGEDEMADDNNNIACEIIKEMLPYTSVKDKVVRYRATQITAQIMAIMQAVEEDLYMAVRHALIRRIRDKYAATRLEAVCALGRLVVNELDEEEQATEKNSDDDLDNSIVSEEAEVKGLLNKLLEVLQHDTSPEVRRALLLHLPVNAKTLSFILERARDKDAIIRRAFYSKVMPSKIGDFRRLGLVFREKLLRWGLRDRDERVRKAAAKMFTEVWIEQIAKTAQQASAEDEEMTDGKKKQVGFHEPEMDVLAELLERIDILNAGQDDAVGLEAMKEFWGMRPDYFDAITFGDEFWSDLSAETAFIARSFYDYCAANPQAQAAAEEEEKIPEVTRLGYHLQKHLNRTLEIIQQFKEDQISEEEYVEQEFMTEQLLHIAHTLDYTDEIGRRKMFGLLRNFLADPNVPEEMTKLTVEGLRLTCTPDAAGEKEFIAVVLEAIAEVHDTVNDHGDDDQATARPSREDTPVEGDSFVSANSHQSNSPQASRSQKPQLSPEEEEARSLLQLEVNLKCLCITHDLLTLVTTDITLPQNFQLSNLLNTLIIPSIRHTAAPLREKAIECLGLCCLLSPSLAKDNRDVFVHCLREGGDSLKIKSLHILDDCVRVHEERPAEPLANTNMRDERALSSEQTIDLKPWTKTLKYTSEVQKVAAESIARLMLAGFYTGKNVEDFDAIIEEAEKRNLRDWELPGKVKGVLQQQQQQQMITAH